MKQKIEALYYGSMVAGDFLQSNFSNSLWEMAELLRVQNGFDTFAFLNYKSALAHQK